MWMCLLITVCLLFVLESAVVVNLLIVILLRLFGSDISVDG